MLSACDKLAYNTSMSHHAFIGAQNVLRDGSYAGQTDHDAVYDVVVIFLQCLDSLFPAHICLRHDELDVFRLETTVIHFLTIILFLLSSLLLRVALNSLALVALSSMVVAGMIVGGLCSKLLGRGSLCLRVEIFDLGLAEDATLYLSVSRPSILRIYSNLHPGVAGR